MPPPFLIYGARGSSRWPARLFEGTLDSFAVDVQLAEQGDTEPAIIAFGNRVDEVRKAEVATEDAVKIDKQTNGLVENAVMQLRGIIRTIKCDSESATQDADRDDSVVVR